ncbi:MAG: hypothetical protein KA144_02085 [Xanthomonadaceae bacterium]|nr:hypothetical protein [Xanthomonadaceae bacterium]
MATLKKILEAARLIERTDGEPSMAPAASNTNDDDLDALIRRAAAADSAPSAREASSDADAADAAPSPESTVAIEEGLDFADIYARQGVAVAPFPVERLMKLVEGLRTLDPTTRRAAITAMDVADETWSMDHVLADADAKVLALRGHQQALKAIAENIGQSNRERIAMLETDRDGAVAALREQIAALEAQIQDAVGSTAAEVAKLQSQSESAKAALQRETLRIDATILNLEELAAQFRPGAKA